MCFVKLRKTCALLLSLTTNLDFSLHIQHCFSTLRWWRVKLLHHPSMPSAECTREFVIKNVVVTNKDQFQRSLIVDTTHTRGLILMLTSYANKITCVWHERDVVFGVLHNQYTQPCLNVNEHTDTRCIHLYEPSKAVVCPGRAAFCTWTRTDLLIFGNQSRFAMILEADASTDNTCTESSWVKFHYSSCLHT